MNNKLWVWCFGIGLLILNGCVLTKVITVPMRVGGAIVSVVPAVGDMAHDAIDEAADQIDDVPL
jgi:hypothetical protein|tara:strand:+ start:271 stop:462 length:192 start_codon:yes stop_codon:yes gene_type:complete